MRADPRLLLKDPAISAPADTPSGMRTVYNPHVASIRAATLANLDLPVEVPPARAVCVVGCMVCCMVCCMVPHVPPRPFSTPTCWPTR